MSLAEALLVEGGAGVLLGEHVLERLVVPLDGGHGVVDQLPDGGLLGLRLQVRPARLRRHPEDALRAVLVGVLGVGPLVLLRLKLRVGLLEGIGDVLEEDQPEDDVLVLGRVHAPAEGVGHPPQLSLVAGGSAVGVLGGGHGVSLKREPHGRREAGANQAAPTISSYGTWVGGEPPGGDFIGEVPSRTSREMGRFVMSWGCTGKRRSGQSGHSPGNPVGTGETAPYRT